MVSGTPLPPLRYGMKPGILELMLLPSAAKKVGLDSPHLHLTLTRHINHYIIRYPLASAALRHKTRDSRADAAAFGS